MTPALNGFVKTVSYRSIYIATIYLLTCHSYHFFQCLEALCSLLIEREGGPFTTTQVVLGGQLAATQVVLGDYLLQHMWSGGTACGGGGGGTISSRV